MSKRKLCVKLTLDLVLLVLLALMYHKRAISMHFHETGGLVLCGLFCFGSFRLVTSGFGSLFTRSFVSMTVSQEGQHPAFEEMEHAPGSGKGMGKGQGNGSGKGMGNGMGAGQGKGMNHPEQGGHGASAGNAVSTFTTYASILCWFAIATAFLSGWFRKRFHTKKVVPSTVSEE